MTQNENDDQFVNTYMLTNDEDQTSTAIKLTCYSRIKLCPFIIAIIFFLLGVVNMIVFYAIPTIWINENKKKLPDAEFSPPNPVLIFIHFLFHSFVIIFSISLLLFSLRGLIVRHTSLIIIFLIISCSLTFIFYITYTSLVLVFTHDPETQMSLNSIISILNNDIPINFAFIFSEDTIETRDCYRNPNTGHLLCTNRYLPCYSKSGVAVPLKSRLISDPYDFSKVSGIFYFTINQIVNMSTNFSETFYDIMDNIDGCDYYDKTIEYYPLLNETYIISNGNTPKSLSHGVRTLSAIFGVGVYYELYSKSIPIIKYDQRVQVDLNPVVNYSNIWTSDSCQNYGECNYLNTKPVPNQ